MRRQNLSSADNGPLEMDQPQHQELWDPLAFLQTFCTQRASSRHQAHGGKTMLNVFSSSMMSVRFNASPSGKCHNYFEFPTSK